MDKIYILERVEITETFGQSTNLRAFRDKAAAQKVMKAQYESELDDFCDSLCIDDIHFDIDENCAEVYEIGNFNYNSTSWKIKELEVE